MLDVSRKFHAIDNIGFTSISKKGEKQKSKQNAYSIKNIHVMIHVMMAGFFYKFFLLL